MAGSAEDQRPRVALVALGCRVNRADVDALAAELGRSARARPGERRLRGRQHLLDHRGRRRRRAPGDPAGRARAPGGPHRGRGVPRGGRSGRSRAAARGRRGGGRPRPGLRRGRRPPGCTGARAPRTALPRRARMGERRGGAGAATARSSRSRTAATALQLLRGAARPRAVPLAPVRRGAAPDRAAGARHPEVVLTGVHLGAYGRDLVAAQVARRARPRRGPARSVHRIRLSSIEPNELPRELLGRGGRRACSASTSTSRSRAGPHGSSPRCAGPIRLSPSGGRGGRRARFRARASGRT